MVRRPGLRQVRPEPDRPRHRRRGDPREGRQLRLFAYNPIGTAGLALGGAVHVVARRTEVADRNLRPVERRLARAQDALLATSAVLTAGSAVQGMRLAGQAPGGAVPMTSGSEPSERTPPKAAALQRSVNALGTGSILAGAGLLVVNALLDRVAFTDPPKRRLRPRRSRR